jgi:MFS family permease
MFKPIFSFFVDTYLTNKKFFLGSIIFNILICSVFFIFPTIPVFIITLCIILINIGTVIRSVTINGLTSVEGKESNKCGELQAIQRFAVLVAGIAVSIAGGYIAEHYDYRWGFVLVVLSYISLFFILKYHGEEPKKNKVLVWRTIKSYLILFKDKKFNYFLIFIFLYYLSPLFGMPLFYMQRDVFHWSATFIGMLGGLETALGALGCLIYFKYAKRANVLLLIVVALITRIPAELMFLYYTHISAIVYTLYGCISMFFYVNMATYMAQRTCPGKEATSFAIYSSVLNIATILSGFLGAWTLNMFGLTGTIIIAAFLPLSSLFFINKFK